MWLSYQQPGGLKVASVKIDQRLVETGSRLSADREDGLLSRVGWQVFCLSIALAEMVIIWRIGPSRRSGGHHIHRYPNELQYGKYSVLSYGTVSKVPTSSLSVMHMSGASTNPQSAARIISRTALQRRDNLVRSVFGVYPALCSRQ